MDSVRDAMDVTTEMPSLYTEGGEKLTKEWTHGMDSGCYIFIAGIGAVSGIITIVGLTGNVLTIIVLRKQAKKSATLFLIMALATVNCLTLTNIGSLSIVYITRLTSIDAVLHSKLLILNYVVFGNVYLLLLLCSSWLNVIIMWHRFNSIKANYCNLPNLLIRTKKQLLIGFVLSLLYCIPLWSMYQLVYSPRLGTMTFQPTTLGRSPTFILYYSTVTFYIAYYILPMGILTCLAYKSVRILIVKRQGHLISTLSQRNQQEISTSLVINVIIFITFQSFGPLRRVLLLFYDSPFDEKCGGVIFYVSAFHILATLSQSAVDFFVYVLCIHRFRKKVKQLFRSEISVTPLPSSQIAKVHSTELH